MARCTRPCEGRSRVGAGCCMGLRGLLCTRWMWQEGLGWADGGCAAIMHIKELKRDVIVCACRGDGSGALENGGF